MLARGYNRETIEANLAGRYVKSGTTGINRYNPGWALWLHFLGSQELHPFAFQAPTFANFLMYVKQKRSEKYVATASSAVKVVYEEALGLDITEPSRIVDVNITSKIRKHMAVTAAPVIKPSVGFDLAILRDYLVSLGPLHEATTCEQLVPRVILIARAFYGFRAADLKTMALTVRHDLDDFNPQNDDHLQRSFTLSLYMTKTAAKTKAHQYYWSYIPLQPLSKFRMRMGFRIRPIRAKSIAEACCLVRALHTLRRLMLPKLQRLHQPYKFAGHMVYAEQTIPWTQSSLKIENDIKFKFLSPSRMNNIIKKVHAAVIGPVSEAKDWIANWYRHNCFSCMESVGSLEAISIFSEHTRVGTYRKNYAIPVHESFLLRLQQYNLLKFFHDMNAHEKLQL
jgi:hypothetical protein